jgi:hypothetical protein
VNEGPICTDYSPIVFPTMLASSVFIYHPNVVEDYRRGILLPFFKYYDDKVDTSVFEKNNIVLATTQLNATLHLLDPAFAENQFTIKVTTLGKPPTNANPATIAYLISFFVMFGIMIGLTVATAIICFFIGKTTQKVQQERKITKQKGEKFKQLLENDYNSHNFQ